MSAYIVDMEHINVLTDYLTRVEQHSALQWKTNADVDEPGVTESYGIRLRHGQRAYAQQIGQMLVDQNYLSVNYRYNEETKAPTYAYHTPQHTNWSPEEILLAIEGYEYQASEHPSWGTSEAHYALEALRSRMINILPKMNEAETWNITPYTTPLATA